MIVNFVLMLTVLLGCCALALDIGLFQLKVLQMQNAADAAALGGMYELDRNNTSNWKTIAQAEAAQNGFTQGTGGTTVTMTNAPTGTWSKDYSAAQAVVSQPASFAFGGILGANALNLSATAVAYAAPCAYFMGILSPYTAWFASNQIYASCPMYIKGGLFNDGFATTSTRALRISSAAGSSLLSANPSPIPYFNVPVLPDPLAWIQAPSFSSCDHNGVTIMLPMMPVVLNPGTYCGGITITMTAMSASVTFNPGLYIVTGGINWQGANVSSNGGVTFYMTKGGMCGMVTCGYGQLYIGKNPITQQASTVNLTAPVSASNIQQGVAGILFFADRNWIPTNPVNPSDFYLDAGTNFTGDGIWYLLNTGMHYSISTSRCPNYCGIVANNIYSYASFVYWNANYSSLPAGSPFFPRGTLIQ